MYKRQVSQVSQVSDDADAKCGACDNEFHRLCDHSRFITRCVCQHCATHCEDHDDDDQRLAHHAPSDDANAGCAPCTRTGQRHITITDADRAEAQELGITHDDVLSNIGDRPHHCDDCDDAIDQVSQVKTGIPSYDDFLKRVAVLDAPHDDDLADAYHDWIDDLDSRSPNPIEISDDDCECPQHAHDDDDDQALSADLPLPW